MNLLLQRILRRLPFGVVFLLVLVPLLGASAQTEGGQVHITQVDNSKFPQVTVYVSVTDTNGNPLPVDPGQIQISENGKLMQPGQVSGAGGVGPLTTLLVIDISGSMTSSGKIAAAKTAAESYVDQMRSGDQAGLLSFNTQATYVQTITADKAALKQAIESLSPKGNTAMFDALVQAAQILQTVSGRKAIIVLTDGIDNASIHTQDEVIQSIGAGGLSISTIGFGNPQQTSGMSGLNETVLRSLAGQAGGVYGYATDQTTLQTLYANLGRNLQSEYKITYTSPLTLHDGLNRTLTVSLTGAASTQGQYNPGGVLPEVAGQTSWLLFGVLLAGLLVLLFAPRLVNFAFARTGAKGGSLFSPRKKPRIKLK